MRSSILLALMATPASAWDFAATPLCTILNDTAALSIRVTFDPAAVQPYTISLTRPVPWPMVETFGLRFDGAAAMTIGTNRHQLSADGYTLTVTDRGFDNVLNGLALNSTASAIVGDSEIPFDLTGARLAVEAFRACNVLPSA